MHTQPKSVKLIKTVVAVIKGTKFVCKSLLCQDKERVKLTEFMLMSAFGPGKALLQLWLLVIIRPWTLSPFLPRAIFHNQVLHSATGIYHYSLLRDSKARMKHPPATLNLVQLHDPKQLQHTSRERSIHTQY